MSDEVFKKILKITKVFRENQGCFLTEGDVQGHFFHETFQKNHISKT